MAFDDADLALATSRLILNLFLLGNPKSGSTFLFSCLRSGPFDSNLRGPYHASRWKDGAYLVTALGTKKEFNFWGGPGWSWGWDWYVGPPVPLSHWEWRSNTAEPTEERLRVGENGNGEPSSIVDRVCRLNATTQDPAAIRTPAGRRARRRAAAVACRRFPLECFGGAPLVRAGCGLVRPLPSTTGCGGPRQRPCESPKVRMSHAWPLTSEVSPRALAIDPSVNTFLSMPAAAEQLQRYHPRASSLKFLVLIREPLARAVSSARRCRREVGQARQHLLLAADRPDQAGQLRGGPRSGLARWRAPRARRELRTRSPSQSVAPRRGRARKGVRPLAAPLPRVPRARRATQSRARLGLRRGCARLALGRICRPACFSRRSVRGAGRIRAPDDSTLCVPADRAPAHAPGRDPTACKCRDGLERTNTRGGNARQPQANARLQGAAACGRVTPSGGVQAIQRAAQYAGRRYCTDSARCSMDDLIQHGLIL